jgi:hypothetical protein
MLLKLKKYLESQKTGQVVIKLKGESHLLKLNLESGEVVYISIGNKPPDETIEYIKDKEIEEVNFIEGIKPVKKVDPPITEKILKLFHLDEGPSAISPDISPDLTMKKNGGIVSPEKVQAVIDIFIDIVGPLGPVLLENIIKRLNYERGKAMDDATYLEFLSYLLKEIPEEKRGLFKNKIT